jgi:hypothetical protein
VKQKQATRLYSALKATPVTTGAANLLKTNLPKEKS